MGRQNEGARRLKGGDSRESKVSFETLETVVGCDPFPAFTGMGSSVKNL